MQQTDDRSLKELFGNLTHSVTTLFRKEIELARAENSEKMSQAGVDAGAIAGGGVLALAALIVLLQALVIAHACGSGCSKPSHSKRRPAKTPGNWLSESTT